MFGLASSACVPTETSSDVSADQAESSDTEPPDVPRTTAVPTMQPTSAEDLGIVLDADGRPYDNYWGPGESTAELRLLTKLEVPGGRIELIEGEAFRGQVPITVRDTTTIDFRESGEFDLRIVWEQRPVDEDGDADDTSESSQSDSNVGDADGVEVETTESILGVYVGLSGRTVERWGAFATAYETSAGLGGITTRSVLDWADRNLDFGESFIDGEFIEGRPFILSDLDEQEGRDTVLFEQGTARTSEERLYTRGFDGDDRLVAIMIWDPRFPWRLAVSQGSPPPDIVEREEELIDCIEGRRLIDKWGRCT